MLFVLCSKADGSISASSSTRPERLSLWEAESCGDAMDFRLLSARRAVCPCGEAVAEGCRNEVLWTSKELSTAQVLSWSVRPQQPNGTGHWTAFFLSFEWPGHEADSLHLIS